MKLPWQVTAGPTLTIEAALGMTLNELPLSICEPVYITTELPPTGAVGLMAMVAVAVVGLVMVSSEMLTPAPRIASVVPCTQLVRLPVMTTSLRVAPWAPLLGLTLTMLGSVG